MSKKIIYVKVIGIFHFVLQKIVHNGRREKLRNIGMVNKCSQKTQFN